MRCSRRLKKHLSASLPRRNCWPIHFMAATSTWRRPRNWVLQWCPRPWEVYRFRAGVEGTMSDLDRVTGIKHLRVRGMLPVRVAAVLKATGLSILRASAFRTGKRQYRRRKSGGSSHDGIIKTVKEQIMRLWGHVRQSFGAFSPAINSTGQLLQQAT